MNRAKNVVGGNVKKYMAEKKLNRRDLAVLLGASVNYVNQLMGGERNFSINVLAKLADALQVNCDDLTRAEFPNTEAYSVHIRGSVDSFVAKEALIDWFMDIDDFVRISNLSKGN